MSLVKKLFAVASTVAMLATGLTPLAAHAAAHSAGSVVKTSDGTVWFITDDGHRRAFTSAGAFLTYGFLNWSQVVDASADDLALPSGSFIPPRDGSIFCSTATKGTDVAGECAFITGGMKSAFTSAAVFSGQGFSFSRAQYGDSSFLSKGANIDNASAAHKPGALVNQSGTIYLVGTSSLLGIPSVDVFNSWGYSFADAVTANAADMAMTHSGVMVARMAGQLNPSFTSNPGSGNTASCSNLQGGAGDLTITNTSTDVDSTVTEGDSNDKVLGFKAEADGSDICINSIKVTLSRTTGTGSENLSRYLDSVSIYKDNTKVASADVSDFTRNSDTPDTFTKTFTLSDGSVDQDGSAKFYVAVTPLDNIDTDDIDSKLTADVEAIRFTDATGAILSVDGTDLPDSQEFDFQDISTQDQIDLKSSSANPDDAPVDIDETSNSDSTLALAFKLDVDQDSQDIEVTDMSFGVDIAGAGTGVTSAEDVIDSMQLKIGGNTYDVDYDSGTLTDGDGSVVYSVSFDSGDVVINSGDVEEGKLYVTFNNQDGNYDDMTTVQVSLDNGDISAETSDGDSISVGGAPQTGALLTGELNPAEVSNFDWSVNSTGTIADFDFTVTAGDEDFDVLAADIMDSATGTATITDTSGTPETTTKGVLSRVSGDAVTADGTAGLIVAAGDTVNFRVRYSLTGSNGTWKEITVDSVAGQTVPDADQVSPTITLNVPS